MQVVNTNFFMVRFYWNPFYIGFFQMAVDMELKKAFAEMQSKMVDSKQKMRMADLQVKIAESS